MPNFEIDLPSAQAKRFDLALQRFVVAELICRPDIDVRTTSYPYGDGIERRAVFISSPEHMEAFRSHWRVFRRALAPSRDVGRAEPRPTSITARAQRAG